MQWVDHEPTNGRNDHQIHVFHRHGTEQNFIAENHRADIALAVFKLHAHRADIRTQTTLAISSRDFFFGRFFEFKLEADFLRQAQKQ